MFLDTVLDARRRSCGAGLALALPCLLGAATAAGAQAQFYPTRSAFLAATSSQTTLDFQTVAPPGGFTQYAAPPGLTLSGVNFSIDPAVSDGNLYAIGQGNPNGYPNDAVLSSQQSTTGTDDLLITFSSPVTAVGLDFAAFTAADTFDFTLSDGETFSRTAGANGAFNFLGLTTPGAITTLDIRDSAQNEIDITNFTFGSALAPVPESSTAASLGLLLALGLGGGAFAASRRVRVSPASRGDSEKTQEGAAN